MKSARITRPICKVYLKVKFLICLTDRNILFSLALAHPTIARLKEEDGLRQNPDHVDDWCRLSARMAEKTSEHFYRTDGFHVAFDSALAATQLDHRDASASVYKFLLQVCCSVFYKIMFKYDVQSEFQK